MKNDTRLGITIIGFGNLVESLWSNIEQLVGPERLASQVNATTVDEAEIDRKRKQYNIDVILNNNLEALEKMIPDIILFAPPPDVASHIIEGDLKVYIESCRSRSKPLPEIYAFPPVPPGAFYQEALGQDVLVVNIIPTPFTVIGGKPVIGEGFYVLTFPSPWPEERKARIKRLFHSYGDGVELEPHQLTDMLGGATTIFAFSQALLAVSDGLAREGQILGHGPVGEYLRARAQDFFQFHPTGSDPCRNDAVDGPLATTLDALFESWRLGVNDYYQEVSFPTAATEIMLARNFDLALHITQVEPREVIQHHLVVAATKGGVLEKAVELSAELTSDLLKEALMRLPLAPDKIWCTNIRRKIRETAHAAREHGLSLSG